MTLAVGARISTYEIVRSIGVGGMGEVYRARDRRLSRDVALKVLPPAMAVDPERLARFEREARAASALSHPNIITIYEVGRGDGAAFIAMELIEGRTLRGLLDFSGAIPLRKALSLAAQIAEGLAKAHAAGIVHRDLKPENLMITKDGFVKILDFGLAKLRRVDFEPAAGAERATVSAPTHEGAVLGTVGYMSPEQASGEPADFRSDQFSFGAILYEMLTGERAFQRPTSAQTLSAIIESEPDPISGRLPKAPTGLIWVLQRCLAKDPEDRYGSTRDLARDLAALRDLASGASTAGVEPPAPRAIRVTRGGLAAAGLTAAAVAVLAYVAGMQIQARREREAPPPPRSPLTFRRGFLTGARFAPDGQTIVYSAAWDGKPSQVFTTRVGSRESREISPGISNAALLAVSSKGELALAIDCDWRGNPCIGTLARVPLAGGAPREIMVGVWSADFSPDGRDLAIACRGGLEFPIGKRLYETGPTGFVGSIRVAPNGEYVAFVDHPRRDSERGILSIVDRSGKVRAAKELARIGPILWSPASDEVFFAEWDGVVRGVRLSGETRRVHTIYGLDDVSPSGLFLDSGMLSEEYRGVIRAGVPGRTEERNLSWLGRSVAADISDDGKHLLMYEEGRDPTFADDEPFTSFLRDTDGSDPKLLGEGRALALSPDGGLAIVDQRSPKPHLALVPTGAGSPQRLPGEGLLYRKAAFFPDGRRILVNTDREGGVGYSYVQDVESGQSRQIGGDEFRAMAVSPDGRRVVGRKDEQTLIVPVEGSDAPRVVAGAHPGDHILRWSADGRALFVRDSEGPPPLVISRLDLATGRRDLWRRLAPPDLTGFLRFGPRIAGVGVTITPDGRYYAYTYFTDQNRLTLAEGGRDWWK